MRGDGHFRSFVDDTLVAVQVARAEFDARRIRERPAVPGSVTTLTDDQRALLERTDRLRAAAQQPFAPYDDVEAQQP